MDTKTPDSVRLAPRESAEDRQKREAAIAAFKARGKVVKECPTMLAKGLIERRHGESDAESYNRFLELREKLTGKMAKVNQPKRKGGKWKKRK